jgi:pantoate--beta-alanine ligase
MENIHSVADMSAWSRRTRAAGKIIGLVPTMGFFHEGHLRLMRMCREQADLVVVSLFVNPIQFGPKEDLAHYPRNLAKDTSLARAEGVAVLFLPDSEDLYPAGFQTRVQVGSLTQVLCGLQRPGHFEGVATIVAKLFHIIEPHCAVFGEKDYQQLAVIRRMVADLNMQVRVLGYEIVREADGLAMSSRNSYLSADERRSAPCLFQALEMARRLVAHGMIDADRIRGEILKHLSTFPHVRMEYVEIIDRDSLRPCAQATQTALLAMAATVGGTRLIDNGRLC